MQMFITYSYLPIESTYKVSRWSPDILNFDVIRNVSGRENAATASIRPKLVKGLAYSPLEFCSMGRLLHNYANMLSSM